MATDEVHPAQIWKHDARQPQQTRQNRLRLAAMAGHMQIDKIAARRAALVDLLADGRPHPRQEIWERVAAQLGIDCWGKVPQEVLARDMAALRRGGIRIAYSRRPETQGYYLQYPSLKRPSPQPFAATNWDLIAALRQLSVPEKTNAPLPLQILLCANGNLFWRNSSPTGHWLKWKRKPEELYLGSLKKPYHDRIRTGPGFWRRD